MRSADCLGKELFMESPKSSNNMVREYQQDNAYLKRAFDSQEQYINLLQQNIVELRNKNGILAGEAAALQNEKDLLRADTEELNNKIYTLLNAKAILNEQVADLQAKSQIQMTDNDNLHKQLDDMQKNNLFILTEKETLELQINALQTENKGLCDQIKELQEDIRNLEHEITLQQNEKEQIAEALRLMTAQFRSIESSTIWSMTKPLRKMLDFFKGTVNGGK